MKKSEPKLLEEIVQEHGLKLDESRVVLMEDGDGDLSILFKTPQGRIAHQFQPNRNPIMYPVMRYQVLSPSCSGRDALHLMTIRAKIQEDGE